MPSMPFQYPGPVVRCGVSVSCELSISMHITAEPVHPPLQPIMHRQQLTPSGHGNGIPRPPPSSYPRSQPNNAFVRSGLVQLSSCGSRDGVPSFYPPKFFLPGLTTYQTGLYSRASLQALKIYFIITPSSRKRRSQEDKGAYQPT